MKQKKLIIIRHASAEKGGYKEDINRKLLDKARGQMIEMSTILKDANIYPDIMIVSPATRTQQTAKALQENLLVDEQKLVTRDKLYQGDALAFIQEINLISKDIDTLFLVAHNPTVGILVDKLTGGLGTHFSTGGIAYLHLDVDEWQEVGSDTAQLIWLKEPSMLNI